MTVRPAAGRDNAIRSGRISHFGVPYSVKSVCEATECGLHSGEGKHRSASYVGIGSLFTAAKETAE
jgi:hypothetical protein